MAQLTQGITPEKISLSLAVGSLCAFFPILGAATPLCLLAGIGLRLNQAVVQAVNGVTSPLYPLVVLGLVRLGGFLAGSRLPDLNPASWAALLQHDPVQFLHRFGPLASSAVLGWAIIAPFWTAACYFCLLAFLRRLASARRLPGPCLP
jgi:uncharacterized protein (DUF2062 family)